MNGLNLHTSVLRKLFEHVYFINGTAYAGKSTMIHMLSQKYNGICCAENYIEKYFDLIEPEQFPNLCYFQTMSGWQEFLSRSPETYESWAWGCSREGAELEILELIRCTQENKKVFVDTNIPLEILREISDYEHIALMLSEPAIAVDRFFERPDKDKQFLYARLLEAEDPKRSIENFRRCLERLNSEDVCNEFERSGFYVLKRDDSRSPEETLAQLERHFKLV